MATTTPDPLSAARERLQRLEQLRAGGLLTDEEYSARRADALDDATLPRGANSGEAREDAASATPAESCPTCGSTRELPSDRNCRKCGKAWLGKRSTQTLTRWQRALIVSAVVVVGLVLLSEVLNHLYVGHIGGATFLVWGSSDSSASGFVVPSPTAIPTPKIDGPAPALGSLPSRSGWVAIGGDFGMKILIPGNWIGGPISQDYIFSSWLDDAAAHGAAFEQFTTNLKQGSQSLPLGQSFAFAAVDMNDSHVGGTGLWSLNVIRDVSLDSNMTTSQYADATYAGLVARLSSVQPASPPIRALSETTDQLGTNASTRLIIERSGPQPFGEVIYVVDSGSSYWTLTLATQASDLESAFPYFEAIARTFWASS